MRRRETNDIVQLLLPALAGKGIKQHNLRVDTTTESSGRKRGDVWISRYAQKDRKFEKGILALIEAKHHKCEIGDTDWRDAMAQGRSKSEAQGLNYYVVSNCADSHRFYNRFTDDEVQLDGKVITQLQPLDVLQTIQAQVTDETSQVLLNTKTLIIPVSEPRFRRSLQRLADIYRSCGLKKGDERIDPTVSFVVLKYIGEKERRQRTLEDVVKVWNDYGTGRGNFKADFQQSCSDIFSGDYGGSYTDFKELISFPEKLKNEHYKQIYEELNQYHLHGCDFDIFGAIYEEFASQTKKKEFGEFYTRRHVTGMMARLLLRKELIPRDLKISDPACGSGGFLTEAYKALWNNYKSHTGISSKTQNRLSNETLWGYDNDEKSVARTKLNMFLVGDGHTRIYHISDSLAEWNSSIGWAEESFDYVLTNPPMGQYDGEASIDSFTFTNEKRYEMLFAERVILALIPGQEAAIILPDGALEATSRENFRKKLLDYCDIAAIVSLPRHAFAPYTKEKTYAVFLRRKEKDLVGQFQDFPIWHFIVDYDGYANSDKRYKTKWHDDMPEVEDLFDGALCVAKVYPSSTSEFNKKKVAFERCVNLRESAEGLSGLKCGFVEPSKINSSNFHNLLSEFHLRPVVSEPLKESDYDRLAIEIIGSSYAPGSRRKGRLRATPYTINDLFDYYPGNHGLTEEVIYQQKPISVGEAIAIYSGSQDNEAPLAYIKPDAINNEGEKITYFEGPCLVLTKDGSAGLLTYKGPEQVFTINHHACVLKLKPAWAGKIHLQWFAYQYQAAVFQVVTSKSDNKVFSTEWFDRLRFSIPPYSEQTRLWQKLRHLVEAKRTYEEKLAKLRAVIQRPIKL